MKTTLALILLTLTSHAQTLKWERSVPINPAERITISGVFGDGVGGGAFIFFVESTPSFHRCVWFNSTGAINFSTDLTTPGENVNRLIPLRVTSKILDLQEVRTANTGESATVIKRYTKGKSAPRTTLLRAAGGGEGQEDVVSTLLPTPDVRGFFTTQFSGSNIVVRRYGFQ